MGRPSIICLFPVDRPGDSSCHFFFLNGETSKTKASSFILFTFLNDSFMRQRMKDQDTERVFWNMYEEKKMVPFGHAKE